MNPRRRVLETMLFGSPDKIPFSPGGGRESTIRRWQGEGLPEGAGAHTYMLEQLGIEPDKTKDHVALGINERMIPQFEEKVLEHAGGHYVVQDWKGNICEISDQYDVTYLRVPKDFVTRRWIRCPVENRDDWLAMRTRFDLDAPGRFPDDFAERCKQAAGRDWLLTIGFPGPFWQMREWCGFEGLCVMTIDQPDLVAEMAEFWKNFTCGIIDRVCEHVVPDVIWTSEDMAYKEHAMISPAMVREFCQPSWSAWTRRAKAAGIPIVAIDSDGFIGELIPLWLESGVNACDPIEVAAGNDINDFRARFSRQMAYRGGVDKRAIAKGGDVIRAELKRIEPVVRDGGFIPGCDHGVPADVSWPNFMDYARLLAEMTGWL